ncbi:CRE-SRV-36 protein [Caenorhabditis remanei]|uniref:CRE-SRV-36 protein n=1 Tax=Caenorhabditis remanei TaxID=31234 RepID=E3MZ86_CAERE|nr:CRE-SRV-36 protein [Caenorhabditis remanei]
MLTTNWQADVVIYETMVFMPIYAVVLWAIWFMRPRKLAFRTHYYTLVMSQGAADFLTVIIFVTQMLPRYFNIGNSLVWWLDNYGASNFYVNSGPQMFILRSIGLFLITMQRYATICRPHGRLSHVSFYTLKNTKMTDNFLSRFQILSITSSFTLILCHWLIAFSLHMPAVLICHAHFENPQSFFVITSEDHKKTSATIVICTFLFCGISTLFMYSSIIRILCSAKRTVVMTTNSWQSRQNRYQEARLCIHVFFLAVMSAATFSYYVFQAIYSNEIGVGDVVLSQYDPVSENRNLQQEALRSLRLWYPLVSGNLSFLNPLMLLLLNRDIQKCFVNFCSGKTMDRTSSILAMNRTI